MHGPDSSNATVADALEELGDLYELDGAIVHRVLAYRAAAKTVRETSVSVAVLAREGRAVELPGIGETLQEKILALLDTGVIPSAERLRAKFPPGLVAITRLPGLGPKRARLLYSELGIDSPQALREAALAGHLRAVRGIGPKLEESLLAALERSESGPGSGSTPAILLPRAIEVAESLLSGLRSLHSATHVQLAGSARRSTDSVDCLRLLAATDRPRPLVSALEGLDEIADLIRVGEEVARARTHSGVAVELTISTPGRLGGALQHLTGSAAHNAALRETAALRGVLLSELGGRGGAGEGRTFATEEDLYASLGLAYIEPELREDRGELDAAAAGTLPRLITRADIRGDLHCHTVASDGRNTIEEMARQALEHGYEYLAITDHSATHGFGNAVSPEQLLRQMELVREANERVQGIELLSGSEVNILPDGSPDYEDELLAELDWVIASVHTAFSMSEQAMTERVITAIEHPLIDAIAHPTGRLIERRAPYAIDLAAVFAAAARTATMLEINANPDRRDLSDIPARAAADAGVRILIDSDAHRTDTLENMRWGVATARRAWLTREQVANTRSWPKLRALGKQTRQ